MPQTFAKRIYNKICFIYAIIVSWTRALLFTGGLAPPSWTVITLKYLTRYILRFSGILELLPLLTKEDNSGQLSQFWYQSSLSYFSTGWNWVVILVLLIESLEPLIVLTTAGEVISTAGCCKHWSYSPSHHPQTITYHNDTMITMIQRYNVAYMCNVNGW